MPTVIAVDHPDLPPGASAAWAPDQAEGFAIIVAARGMPPVQANMIRRGKLSVTITFERGVFDFDGCGLGMAQWALDNGSCVKLVFEDEDTATVWFAQLAGWVRT